MSICRLFWNFQTFSVFLSIIKFYVAFLAKKNPMIRIHLYSCSDFACFFHIHQNLPEIHHHDQSNFNHDQSSLAFLPITILQFNVDRWTFCKKKIELRINGFSTESSMVSLKCNHFIDIRERKKSNAVFLNSQTLFRPEQETSSLACTVMFFCWSVFFLQCPRRKADARKASKNFTTLFFVRSYRNAFYSFFFKIYDFIWIFDNCCQS